ncbi:SdrD B-like domain-containing protein, partial [Spirosoma sp. 48-14]|uniref:SdrD B-like domain-containing protein n=1 Tax=Spirosoma sp. 48-14 TaxID=1895854 RepID=UPI0025F371F8
SLPAGQSTTRNIVFTVGSGVTGSLTNTAEISSAGNAQNLPDKDSDPDNNPNNDGTPVNDDTSGDHKNNPSQDEDDSDPEVINVSPAPVFDLALKKTLAAGQSANVTPGSSVTFTVTVYNQGNVDATNVQVTDYIPTGLTLNDGNWTASGSLATLNSVIASLPAGQSTTRNIVFTVGSGVTGSLTNTAEISSAGNAQNLPDKDSDPDNNPNNDGTPVNDDTSGDHKNNPSQDEDDSDPEVINVTPVVKASLGDYVWFDTNQNGQQDPTETGVASVTAVLYNATTNQPISTTVTDANGKYLFTNLDPGSYYVKFTAPSGMTFTSANVGNDATDSDAGVGGQTSVYSLTAGQQELTVDAGLIPVSINCVPASYTLCGAKTSFTLTAGSMYTNVQWYKDGVAIPGATSIDYVATAAGLYSYSALEAATGCSTSLCCPISITTCPVVCEKPILSLVDPICAGNGFYSISLISSTTNLIPSAGQVSGASIVNIPIGTPISVTASNGVGCYNVLTADSPTGCSNNGNNNCTPPRLSVGQPLCQGTGFYTVSYRLVGTGSVSSNVGNVNTVSRVIENIPLGQNVQVTATGSGTCVTRVTVVSPASCTNPCENPAITLSGPECVAGSSTYEVSYTVAAGTSVQVNQGVASNGVISGIPSGIPVSVTVTTTNGCSPKVVIVPPASCTVCTALGLNTGTTLAQCGQANGIATVVVNAGSGVAPYTYQWTNASGSVVSSSSVAQGLAPGVYTVSVTDSKGCTGQKQVTISSTSAPLIVAQVSSTSCGVANGSASVQVSNGSGNYSYQWTSAAGIVVGSSASLVNLSAGTYMVS